MATSITASLSLNPRAIPANGRSVATLTLANTGTVGTAVSVAPTKSASSATNQPGVPVNLGSAGPVPGDSTTIPATSGTWSTSWDVTAFGQAPGDGEMLATYWVGCVAQYYDGATLKQVLPTVVPLMVVSNPNVPQCGLLRFDKPDRAPYVAAF